MDVYLYNLWAIPIPTWTLIETHPPLSSTIAHGAGMKFQIDAKNVDRA